MRPAYVLGFAGTPDAAHLGSEEALMNGHHGNQGKAAYLALAAELVVDFAIMYLVMYTMIDGLEHLRFNLNNVYMTLMMVAPMTIVMLVAMRSMFPTRRLNLALIVGALAVFLLSFFAMRNQTAIGDEEFLRAMIPHHSGAILMCERASLRDPEIVALCDEVVQAQQAEISQMEGILQRLQR